MEKMDGFKERQKPLGDGSLMSERIRNGAKPKPMALKEEKRDDIMAVRNTKRGIRHEKGSVFGGRGIDNGGSVYGVRR